jgi:hypothetical protein
MRAPVGVELRSAPRTASQHLRPWRVARASRSTAGGGPPRTARGRLTVAVPVGLIAGTAAIAPASVSAAVVAPEGAAIIPWRLPA